MKLMIENTDIESLDFLQESVEGKKSWKIQGPFLQAETKNRNGRIYPQGVIEREVNKYTKERIATKRAMGELDHPPTPQLNLDRVSHLIENLSMDGNTAIGTAKLLDTPMGLTAQALLNGGVKLGVSSRGLGSLKGETVGHDYNLICVDIVGDPSALNAYVDGILESKDFIIDNNAIVERAVENLKKGLDVSGSKKIADNLSAFLSSIRNDF
tara:strand:- start:12417 stop:13052 length:636 start_codon:yes stop_codon:yes gene_type:complete